MKLKHGQMIRVKFGESGGTQLAQYCGDCEQNKDLIWCWKFSKKSKTWSKNPLRHERRRVLSKIDPGRVMTGIDRKAYLARPEKGGHSIMLPTVDNIHRRKLEILKQFK